MTGSFLTLLVIVGGALLLAAYARKLQQGGFTKTELDQLKSRAIWITLLVIVIAVLASSIVVVPVGQRMVVFNLLTKGFRKTDANRCAAYT